MSGSFDVSRLSKLPSWGRDVFVPEKLDFTTGRALLYTVHTAARSKGRRGQLVFSNSWPLFLQKAYTGILKGMARPFKKSRKEDIFTVREMSRPRISSFYSHSRTSFYCVWKLLLPIVFFWFPLTDAAVFEDLVRYWPLALFSLFSGLPGRKRRTDWLGTTVPSIHGHRLGGRLSGVRHDRGAQLGRVPHRPAVPVPGVVIHVRHLDTGADHRTG